MRSTSASSAALAMFPITPPRWQRMRDGCTSSTRVLFFQAEEGIRDHCVTGVQTCALAICANTLNFHLVSGSPLISAGAVLTGFSDDFDGRRRPQSAAWDIGAYNHQVNPPTNLRLVP